MKYTHQILQASLLKLSLIIYNRVSIRIWPEIFLRICLIVLLLNANFVSFAQNIAPNPSFEIYNNCPPSVSCVLPPSVPTLYVQDWSAPTDGTSDYFNTCAAYPAGVPGNICGWQLPKTGNAYLGTYVFAPNNNHSYREYIQTKLTTPMSAGHHYYISYWVSLAEFVYVGAAVVAVDQLGVLLIPDSIENSTNTNLSGVVPQLVSPYGQVFDDTAHWTNINGVYTAAGNERWMILGCFEPYASLNTSMVIPHTTYPDSLSYYYYDDVCVLDLDGIPFLTASHDSTNCSTAGMELKGRDNCTSYLWNDGDTAQVRTVEVSGTYWVKSIKSGDCLFYVDTFNINTLTHVDINLGNDTTICNNAMLTLDAHSDNIDNYLWNTGATTSAIQVNTTGIYYITAWSDCYEGSDTIIVSVTPLPELNWPPDTMACNRTEMNLSFNEADVSFQWNTGSDSCCITVTQPGLYTLTVTNICGQKVKDSIRITFTECGNCLFVPNAFSPNGDDINDVFNVMNVCELVKFSFQIFNRWGKRVFITDRTEKGWDGKVNGISAEAGTYHYYIQAQPLQSDVDGIFKKGDLLLIR